MSHRGGVRLAGAPVVYTCDMPLTLSELSAQPHLVTYMITIPSLEPMCIRPLAHQDAGALGIFLASLSPQTRRFSLFPSYDHATAQMLCDAINRYDKLRFVVELTASHEIIGLLEFSFGLPDGDITRYRAYRVPLDVLTDCRFGPTLADAYQGQGLGSSVFPTMVDVARNFGKRRIILWGGVLADNARAIRFYEKQGFRTVGSFLHEDGELTLDMLLELQDN